MTRCVYLTFFGEYRGGHASAHEADLEHETHVTAHEVEVEHEEEHAHAGPHESGPLLTVPLIILAVLSTVAGFLNWAAWPFHTEKFSEWFEPTHRSAGARARHLCLRQGDPVGLPRGRCDRVGLLLDGERLRVPQGPHRTQQGRPRRLHCSSSTSTTSTTSTRTSSWRASAAPSREARTGSTRT